METRPAVDVVSRTLAACIVFCWLLMTASPWLLATAFSMTLLAALVVRLRFSLFLLCLVVPLLPILVSHLVLEPMLSGQFVGRPIEMHAGMAWLRVGGMALLSVAWIRSLDLRRAAELCRLVGGGQYVLLPLMVAATFVGVTRERWVAIRELQALRQAGRLRERTRVALRELPNVGLQLTMASLFSAGELALACSGRGIGARRAIAVSLERPSIAGILLVLTLLAGTVIAFRAGVL